MRYLLKFDTRYQFTHFVVVDDDVDGIVQQTKFNTSLHIYP